MDCRHQRILHCDHDVSRSHVFAEPASLRAGRFCIERLASQVCFQMQKVLRPALLSLIFLTIIALIVVMGGIIAWDVGWIHLADDHAPTISRDHVLQALSPDKE